MNDVYKNAMDAVKAPDALVDKTLKLMIEEHKKLETKAEPAADLKEIKASTTKASPKKTRWMTQVALPAAACLCLLLSVLVPRLVNRGDDVQHPPVDLRPGLTLETLASDVTTTPAITEVPARTESPETTEKAAIIMEALAADNLSTRSGPASEYRETGTYPLKGEPVRLISLAYDASDVGWVQCEVLYRNELRRVYTGIKRFDAASFDLDSVPIEVPLNDPATVAATSKAMYGPGDGYATYADLTVDEGQTVTVIAMENDYAQVEWTTAEQSYRAWVSVDVLSSR